MVVVWEVEGYYLGVGGRFPSQRDIVVGVRLRCAFLWTYGDTVTGEGGITGVVLAFSCGSVSGVEIGEGAWEEGQLWQILYLLMDILRWDWE